MRGNIGGSIDIQRREGTLEARRGIVYDCIGHIMLGMMMVGRKGILAMKRKKRC